MMMAGAAGSTAIVISSQTITDSGPGNAFASYAISEGNVYSATFWNGGGILESVVSPSGAYTLFEVKAELSSGTTPDGSALSSYFDLNTDSPQWTLTQSGAGSDTCTLDVTVREKANTANNKTVAVILDVTGIA